MAGWKHSSVAKCTELESTYVPSVELADDAGSDPTIGSESELILDSESVNESTIESEPTIDSSPKPESRTDGCNNSYRTKN